jgi:hypothetical protein
MCLHLTNREVPSIRIDPNVSRNFQVAKVLSILSVVLGHSHLLPVNIWVPVTIGLLIFSFSSGYFTSLKYNGNFSRKEFWLKKGRRLGVNLAVINIFLFILFLIQGRSGIWTWHTIVNLLGLNGFLNWFYIRNISPFGAGMWFFTLLLVFYLFYPVLERLNRNKIISYLFVVLFVIAAFYLNKHIIYGHALWLTACGFVIGVFCAKNDISISLNVSGLILGGVLAAMLSFNYLFGLKDYNFFFILFFAVFGIFSFINLKLSALLVVSASYFSGCLLEIYLIHTYLFVKPTGYRFADFAISLLLILTSAKILQTISTVVMRKVRT